MGNNQLSTKLVSAGVTTIFCLIYALFVVGYSGEYSGLSGWFVPDGVSMWNAAIADSDKSLMDLVTSYKSMWGFAVVNAYFINLSWFLPALFNLTLLICISIRLVHYKRLWFSALVLLFVPYYLVAFLLPSKDIVIALLFLIFIDIYKSSFRYRQISLIIICFFVFITRDGYGVILLGSIIFLNIVEYLKLNKWFSIISIGLGLSLFWLLFEKFFVNLFVFTRSMGVAESGGVLNPEDLLTPIAYFIRVFGNATNLAFRPVFFDMYDQFSILSFAYWISGIFLLMSLMSFVYAIKSQINNDVKIGMLGLIILLLISVTPYVQPRYLFPLCLLAPMLSFFTVNYVLKNLLIVLVISVLGSLAYQILDNYPAVPLNSTFGFESMLNIS